VIQIIASIIGGNAAASVVTAQEYRFGGVLAHTLVGALGGTFSGLFLQTLAATVVTASGSIDEITVPELVVIQALAGAAAGGAAVLIAGVVKHSLAHHKATQSQTGQSQKDAGPPH
jgi:hypothetical protein